MDHDTWLEAPYVAEGEAEAEYEAMAEYIDERYEKVTDEVYRDNGEYFRISENGRWDGEDWVDYRCDLDDIEDIKEIVEELESKSNKYLEMYKKAREELKALKGE